MKKTFQKDRYVVLSRLGVGGIATVWRVLDSKFEVERAIKVLQREQMSQESIQQPSNGTQRFVREATVMMRLHHQNIITVFDSFEEEGCLCIVMEKCFASLDQWVSDNGSMPVGLATQVMISMLNGLGHAHTKGVIHRDVKPHNILISDLGDIKITDFGLALTSFSTHSITKTNAVLGSIQFMSPEQRKDSKHIESSTDIYSCAMTLAYLLEGHSVDDLYLPETLSYLRSKYPDAVVDIIAKAGQRTPDERYTAKDMMKALKIALPSLPQSTHSLMNVTFMETFLEDLNLPVSKEEEPVSENTSMVVVPTSVYGLMGVIVLLLVAIAIKILAAPEEVVVEESSLQEEHATARFSTCTNVGSGYQQRRVLGPRESSRGRFFDLDQDGMNDALFMNRLDNSLSVYWGNSNFDFVEAQEIPFTRTALVPLFSDVDKDGELDIIGLNTSNNRITISKGLGNRSFRMYRKGGPEDMFQDPTPQFGAVHDMNGDGYEDLLFISSKKTLDDQVSLMYRENSKRGLDYEMEGIPDVPEETFNWHSNLYAFSYPVSFGIAKPDFYWIEDNLLWKQRVSDIRTFSKKEMVLGGLDDGEIITITTLGRDFDTVVLHHQNDVIMWSQEEGGCTLLSNYRKNALRDVGYWNNDKILDLLVSHTCSYCTSNHMLFIGQP